MPFQRHQMPLSDATKYDFQHYLWPLLLIFDNSELTIPPPVRRNRSGNSPKKIGHQPFRTMFPHLTGQNCHQVAEKVPPACKESVPGLQTRSAKIGETGDGNRPLKAYSGAGPHHFSRPATKTAQTGDGNRPLMTQNGAGLLRKCPRSAEIVSPVCKNWGDRRQESATQGLQWRRSTAFQQACDQSLTDLRQTTHKKGRTPTRPTPTSNSQCLFPNLWPPSVA